MTHTDDTERKAFEAWISAPPFEQSVRRYGNDPQTAAWPGNYREYNVQLAWCAWEARAALAAPSVPSGEPADDPHAYSRRCAAAELERGPWGKYAAPQPAPAGWRPIETAPKDGTEVLLSCPHGTYVCGWGHDDFPWWHVDDNKHGPYPLRGSAPTHWMPLPAAPAAPGGEG